MTTANTQLIRFTNERPIATIELAREEARNALSLDLLASFHDAVDALQSSDAQVLVIKGSGRAFCAGMDLKAVLISVAGDESLGGKLLSSLADLTLKIRALPMVTIASVNGAAIGGGCGLTCVCDITVSHADAKLGFPEVDLGLCPAVIAPWVVKKLGVGTARRALLMGGVMSGTKAHEIGLVDHLAPDRDGLDKLTDEIAKRLASGGPKALAATKGLLNALDGSEERSVLARAAALSASVLATPEAQATLEARLNPNKS